MAKKKGSGHIIPAGENVFSHLGFSEEESKKLKSEANEKIKYRIGVNTFAQVDENTYVFTGDMRHARRGWKDDSQDENDLLFFDASCCKMICAGYKIEGRPVIKISYDIKADKVYFLVGQGLKN